MMPNPAFKPYDFRLVEVGNHKFNAGAGSTNTRDFYRPSCIHLGAERFPNRLEGRITKEKETARKDKK